jgi:nicotinate phosphoribosyltransferase
MRGGKRLTMPQSLADLRQRAATQLARLPESLRTLDRTEPFPVTVSLSLRESARALDEQNVRKRMSQ